MYRNLKFLHMTDFFSTDTVLVSVTNMRYAIGFLVTESLEEAHFDLETEDNHLLENIKEKQLLVTFETFYQTDLDKNKDKEKGGSRRLLVNT